uniref:Reverse transcriptase domain-containing protein n=1 Tax=Cacopsylla melanoneura TaxID=428564 RepID=A0A8D8ZDH8_9HEMI
MPHHPVVKIGSSTPVRPVFDGSAKEIGKYSLNECLDKGPNLIEKIPACLARLRQGKVGVSGDIEKAFLQISLNEKDRDYLRFVWINEEGQTVVYRHCRVVFGVSPSPFLLESCINLHLQETLTRCEDGTANHPIEFVKKLAGSFYVDNCLTSCDSMEEAREFAKVAASTMAERKFVLRGWEYTGDSSSNGSTNVLGLLWNREEDVLSVNTSSLLTMKYDKITKKVMLSAAHRLFDPVGMLSCVLLVPKLLIQETWREKCSWNEKVSLDLQEKFQCWMNEVDYQR